jgi:hypothetical protein
VCARYCTVQVSVDAAAASGLPGTGGAAKKRPVARSRCLALSPTGRAWAACTTEGLQLYTLDDEMVRTVLQFVFAWFVLVVCKTACLTNVIITLLYKDISRAIADATLQSIASNRITALSDATR